MWPSSALRTNWAVGRPAPVAKRWVVERTFAWLTGFRRLAIDYEFTPRFQETWLLIANLTMCLNRLAPA